MDRTLTSRIRTEEKTRPRDLPRLRLLYLAGQVLEIPKELPPLRIGTTPLGRKRPDRDGLELADPTLSKSHAAFLVGEDLAVSVRDLSSKNGTFVNGERVSEATQLTDGDVVQVGDSFLILRYEDLPQIPKDCEALFGFSPAVSALRHTIRRIAPENVNVLILGESGTGKELVGQHLHSLSPRKGSLVPVNCPAVPASLAESQFFGQLDGSFTGAKRQPGYITTAHHGTLFLDEVADLPIEIQAKLLRVIQDRAVTSVGSVQASHVDVRFVAATNRPLKSLVSEGQFREELYHRLNEFVILTPPLRERREDILALLYKSITAHPSMSQIPKSITASIQELLPPHRAGVLLTYYWPGNVRELVNIGNKLRLAENAKERDEIISGLDSVDCKEQSPSRDQVDSINDVALQSHQQSRKAESRNHDTKQRRTKPGEAPFLEKQELEELMRIHHGVRTEVAVAIGCSRRHLGRLLAHHQISDDE